MSAGSCFLSEGEKNHKVERLVCSSSQAEQMCVKPHMVLTITETAVFSLCHSSHTRTIRFLFSVHQVGWKLTPSAAQRTDVTLSFLGRPGVFCQGTNRLSHTTTPPAQSGSLVEKENETQLPFFPRPLRSFTQRAPKRATLTKEELVSSAE